MGLNESDGPRRHAPPPDAPVSPSTGSADPARGGHASGLTRGLRWGPLGIVAFWLVLMGVVYLAMDHYLQPARVVVTATGDLEIPRARDGHFYASGSVNGRPVRFLVDTGASLVTVSEAFARQAGLAQGVPTVFRTANGDMPGRIVSGVPVGLGPLDVSGVRVAVGFVGHEADQALLGQSFLSRFEIVLQRDRMLLRKR